MIRFRKNNLIKKNKNKKENIAFCNVLFFFYPIPVYPISANSAGFMPNCFWKHFVK